MQTMQQASLRGRIEAVIGHPILAPASSSNYRRTDEDIDRFDPHSLPDDLMSETPSSILKREIATRTSEDITHGLLKLYREGAEELPTCKPFVRAFLSTRMAHVGMAAELPCGSWECKKCGPKLKLKWYLRHVNYIADETFLEKIIIDKDDWQATHRMINRQHEKFMKYEQHDGSLLTDHDGAPWRTGNQARGSRVRSGESLDWHSVYASAYQPVSQLDGFWERHRGTGVELDASRFAKIHGARRGYPGTDDDEHLGQPTLHLLAYIRFNASRNLSHSRGEVLGHPLVPWSVR